MIELYSICRPRTVLIGSPGCIEETVQLMGGSTFVSNVTSETGKGKRVSKGNHIKRRFLSSLTVVLMALCIGRIACGAPAQDSPEVISNGSVALKSVDGNLQVYRVDDESERLLGSIEVDINAGNWVSLVTPKSLASSEENAKGGKVLRYDCKGKAGKDSEVICRITPDGSRLKLKYEVVYNGDTAPSKSRIMFRFPGEDLAPIIQGKGDRSEFVYDNFTLELAHPEKDFGWKGGKRGSHHQMNIKNIDEFALNVGINNDKTRDNYKPLTIICPQVHQDRMMKGAMEAFEQHSGKKSQMTILNDRSWSKVTDSVANDGFNLLFTSSEDWEYRADDEDREKLRYVPLARQLAFRVDKEVGSVEYGIVVRREEPKAVAQEFLEFIDSPEMQAVLEKPDPYHYVSLDHPVKEFEVPEWYGDPLQHPEPQMWFGMCQVRGGEFFSTVLAELKMMWMAGFNQATGTTNFIGDLDRIMAWANDHNMAMAGIGIGSRETIKETVQEVLEFPYLNATYVSNEDFISRVYYPLYSNVYQRQKGEDVEEMKGVKAVEDQFPRWARRKHGSLEEVNRKWGTSYDSWDEIGFPELPLDWVQKIYQSTGLKEEKMSTGDAIHTLFHQPLHFDVLADNAELLDFQRYMREAWARKYKNLAPGQGPDQFWDEEYTNYTKDIQSLIEGKFFYTTKARKNPYPFREVPEFNAAGYTHMICTVPPHLTQTMVDTIQIAEGRPLWNAEDHLYNHGTSTPRRVKYRYMHKFLMGMYKSSAYNRETNFMSGRPDQFGHYDSAERGEHYKAHVQAITDIRRNQDVFRAFYNARKNADISVLVTEGNRSWNTLPDAPGRPELGGAPKAYGYLSALGRHWKYVLNQDVDESHCPGTLIVDAPWLMPETLEKINALPEDRRIIVVGEVPSQDEYGNSLPADKLEQVRERAEVIDTWESLDEVVEPVDGLSSPYTEIAKGDFWFWGPVAGTTNFTMPVPELEVRRVRHNGKLYIAVTNHSGGKETVAPLPWAGNKRVRELTAEDRSAEVYPEGEYLSFAPYSVRIFEVSDAQ